MRFLQARNGDHVIVPFQCELCHFRNVYGREPEADNYKDKELFVFARKANLHSFWSREHPTVRNNLKELIRMMKTEKRFGFVCTTPPLGPFPVNNDPGMKAAIAILDRSLDKGSYGPNVQWATFRKLMSGVRKTSQAGVKGLGDSVGAYKRNKIWISKAISHQFWFSRFMVGVHKPVGEVKRQDGAFTIQVILQIQVMLELDWTRSEASSKADRRRTAELGGWFIVGFCCGMRGEEIFLLELADTRNSLEAMLGDKAYFKVVLSGRSKANQISGSKFSFSCINVTSGSGLTSGVWIKHLVQIRSEESDGSQRIFFRVVNLTKPKPIQD